MWLTLKTAMVLAAGLPPVTPGNGLPGISTVTGFLGGLENLRRAGLAGGDAGGGLGVGHRQPPPPQPAGP